jgi:hypothetical protein
MVTVSHDSVVILRQGTESPNEAEWDECLEILRGKELERVKVLVVTDGGAPTPGQQRRLSLTLRGHPVPVAVVSESAAVRFVVSSVALITRRIRSFRTEDLDQAYAHLDLTRSERDFVTKTLPALKSQIS